jgi:hypothetical protein
MFINSISYLAWTVVKKEPPRHTLPDEPTLKTPPATTVRVGRMTLEPNLRFRDHYTQPISIPNKDMNSTFPYKSIR